MRYEPVVLSALVQPFKFVLVSVASEVPFGRYTVTLPLPVQQIFSVPPLGLSTST
jgi:hypothetical protein